MYLPLSQLSGGQSSRDVHDFIGVDTVALFPETTCRRSNRFVVEPSAEQESTQRLRERAFADDREGCRTPMCRTICGLRLVVRSRHHSRFGRFSINALAAQLSVQGARPARVECLPLLNPVAGELPIVDEPTLDHAFESCVDGRSAVSVLHQPLSHFSATTWSRGKKEEGVLVGAFGIITVEQL